MQHRLAVHEGVDGLPRLSFQFARVLGAGAAVEAACRAAPDIELVSGDGLADDHGVNPAGVRHRRRTQAGIGPSTHHTVSTSSPYWAWAQAIRFYAAAHQPEEIRAAMGRGMGYIAEIAPELREISADMELLPLLALMASAPLTSYA